MTFVLTYDFPNLPGVKPGRMYVHSRGSELFKGDGDYMPAINYTLSVLNGRRELFEKTDFVIPILWAERDAKMAEIFGYGPVNDWPGNPAVYNWVFKNGTWLPAERHSFADTLLLLAEEEIYRRMTPSLKEYIENPPVLPPSLLLQETSQQGL